jgi:uncharacterized protein YecT (DUF1311 family)
MSKKFISLLVFFLLSSISSAGQDAANECRTIVPKGWTPTLEQAQIFIEDESAAKTRKNQRFLTQTSQSMADLRDAQLFITYVQLMQALDVKERRDLFCDQKRWLSAREKSARVAVDSKGGSLEPLEFSEAFRKITEERQAVLEKRLADKQTATGKNQIKDGRQP